MKPTSQKDIDDLDALLTEFDRLIEASGDEDADAPMVGQVDGFLTALVVSTEEVAQNEWLAALLPGVDRHLSLEAVERLVALIVARKAVIALELMRGQIAFEPIYDYNDRQDEALWDIWIEGFDGAVQLRHPFWLALLGHKDSLVAGTFQEFATLISIARGDRQYEEVFAEAPDTIPLMAEILYCGLRDLPSLAADEAEAQPQQPIRVTKVGRNEPCPCGSGKKYKKCCGQAA